ncbi:MAG: hypothetical protein HY211_06270 [Candidatus Omnitrophica bacterium]|nr:hypothetical protein [Candidatus Omnitrophota bacterium]
MKTLTRRDLLAGSRFAAFVRGRFTRWSNPPPWLRPFREELLGGIRPAPLKTIGIVLVTAMPTHLLTAILAGKPPGAVRLGFLGLLFLLGCWGLRDNRPWGKIREGSLLLRRLTNE